MDAPAIMTFAKMTKRITPTTVLPEGEADVRVADERDEQRRGGAELLVGELQGEPGEDDADEGLTDELLLRPEPEAALLADLDEVVEEADEAQAGVEEEHEEPARRRGVEGEQVRAK